MTLVRFLESPTGRLVRGAAGLALVGIGAWLGTAHASTWWLLAALGLVPLGAGISNSCLVAPLFGAPVRDAAGSR